MYTIKHSRFNRICVESERRMPPIIIFYVSKYLVDGLKILAHAHQGKHHPQAVNGRLRRPRAPRCRWAMSSYEGDHVIAIDDMYITHSTAVSRTLHIGRNPPTTAPSTRDDVTLQGSPAACSRGCEAPQPASCISFNAGMVPTDGAQVQLTFASPTCKTRPRGHPQRTQSSHPKYVHRPPR